MNFAKVMSLLILVTKTVQKYLFLMLVIPGMKTPVELSVLQSYLRKGERENACKLKDQLKKTYNFVSACFSIAIADFNAKRTLESFSLIADGFSSLTSIQDKVLKRL